MKDFKKSHDIAGQSNVMQKSHKHDANLQKNSSLYFQVGLILCLLATYAIFEMRFETTVFDDDIVYVDPDETVFFTPNYVVEPDAPKKVEVTKKKQVIIDKDPKIVDDDTAMDDTTPEFITEPVSKAEPVDLGDFTEPKKPDEFIDKPLDLSKVEIVPVYPGCEKKKTNADRIKCLNEKITKLVQRKFDTDLASELGLYGRQRITVQFKIDQNGQVTDIKTRAPHPSLGKEAERVTNKIPKMTPGLQRDKPVSVIYNLPIVFNVNQ
ncbi:energy transducer TonB [Psychroserpens algicola]|uniref:Energy transducer TonB n=1 Tax=Psychroserpens algicola TaxID=1719034 RepID=A0ABT0HC57_9FLAO|nr:energy transducer TonB [Psychroserpens algicola]MCK8481943.1 energy transducer TonB [Psychroserpens algicola]